MIQSLRQAYNEQFTQEKYQAFLEDIAQRYDHRPPFRICETPVFVPRDLKNQLMEACDLISDRICQPDFKELSQSALLPGQEVPDEDEHTTFLQMDFGICQDENGRLYPQLIEVQGFPSLYFFQYLVAQAYREHFDIPDQLSSLFDGLSPKAYLEALRHTIVGECDPREVIFLEVDPYNQVTYIDFRVAERELGIRSCCVTDLIRRGQQLFYKDDQGMEVPVKRIVNRVIFDELMNRADMKDRSFRFTEPVAAEWIGHPNWFFRISKHTLPFLKNQYVPESTFLSDLEGIPADLDQYVLKPLYSFAGSGVVINLNRFDIENIKDPENYILQRKVEYAPVVETPGSPAKCEIRMLMLWNKKESKPRMINNLVRVSKGAMVGVRYNKNKDWVGGSVGFFEI